MSMNLITDRTAEDVARARYLLMKTDLTAAEKQELASDLKGCYNASDINRVGNALNYVCGRLNANGFNLSVSAKTDWTDTDIPTVQQMTAYKEHIASIRSAIAYPAGTPAAPEIDRLTYTGANNIETILLLCDSLIDKLIQTFIHSGTTCCGIIGGLIL